MPDFFYHSAEIRWFLPDRGRSDQMIDWFRLPHQELVVETENYVLLPDATPFVKLERERVDEYLLMPGCATVGVKQRQGRLEVKALVAGPRPFTQGDVVGRADQWMKWSFNPSDEIANLLEGELDQSGPWCRIGKKRYLQKYSFDLGNVVAVSPDRRPDTGCNVEFTVLTIDESVGAWFTFGFEAFGPSSRITAYLHGAVQHFFALHGPAPVPLSERDSLSYPAWLKMLHP